MRKTDVKIEVRGYAAFWCGVRASRSNFEFSVGRRPFVKCVETSDAKLVTVTLDH